MPHDVGSRASAGAPPPGVRVLILSGEYPPIVEGGQPLLASYAART